MNYRLVFKLLGSVMCYEAVFILPSLLVSVIYSDGDTNCFIFSIIILVVFGLYFASIKPKDLTFRSREGFAAVSLSWVVLSVFGALPFYFSGHFGGYINCLFESASGFTTTAATVLEDVESLPRGILFWRAFTNWIGGMGVLVLMIAIMPNLKASGINLLKAESPGPTPNKLVPKIRETAKIMYFIYAGLTALNIILLKLSGMPWYDSFIHGFSTAGTGGFSIKNHSIGAYNSFTVEVIIAVFALLFGVNFTLYFYLIKKNLKSFLFDEELIWYGALVMISISLINFQLKDFYADSFTALRHSSFQVVSIVTTTGFVSADFGAWPTFSKSILILLMFIGACGGSTGCGIKIVRILILFKGIKSEIYKVIHPKIVNTVKINKIRLEYETVHGVFMFFFIYFAMLIVGILIVSIDGHDLVTTSTAVISSLSNIGQGFGLIAPGGNFMIFSPMSKLMLTFCMLAGRLEFYPVLILFAPSVWKKGVF